ncbi:glutamyl-tRNA amidotransferase [candidate division WWE3 bacterium CG10_big_fil_rev_8_21_14_0_10_48_23]|uniref:Glutamyl-tRNA amidotransferase n=1 Tax=candidate division WWE3 bacterium CG_4_9_14_0_2_um_filter_48_10 TaxID=1975078 RepID=A0A2M8EJ15_UNCKA|nr:MAG: glutamyl-tRNA amidotransferase [candidate division WWE3 bacterium CG_4_9_14_0_2_um_filter_48_10]PJE50826.1 MAG: glutamyl-tRNA amidotransferase [candidate division WWE3 bacterium CG10_big_fil_rev_8_21_14_0_10_48_23]
MEADTLKKIKAELLEALKSSDRFRADTLRYLLSVIHNAEISKGKGATLTEEELAELLQKQGREREESIAAYEKGNRPDLVEKEKKELEIIKGYLPEQFSEEEIKKLAEEAIAKVGAKIPQDMGRVMGVLMPEVKGKADGALVAKVVKELLG